MKIKLYKDFEKTPFNTLRSVKSLGRSIKQLNTQNHTGQQIMQRLAKYREAGGGKNGKYLVVLSDRDYENSLIGGGEEIQRFIRNCLEDGGLMSRKQGGQK